MCAGRTVTAAFDAAAAAASYSEATPFCLVQRSADGLFGSKIYKHQFFGWGSARTLLGRVHNTNT